MDYLLDFITKKEAPGGLGLCWSAPQPLTCCLVRNGCQVRIYRMDGRTEAGMRGERTVYVSGDGRLSGGWKDGRKGARTDRQADRRRQFSRGVDEGPDS